MLALYDYSKYSCVRIMRHKSGTHAQLQKLVRRCGRQLAPLVEQRACSGQSGQSGQSCEFIAGALREFYCEPGILPKTTVGYVPSRNGTAERLVCSIASDGRTMHHDAALPPSQWGTAMHHASWVRNRMPHSGTGRKAPYELQIGKRPVLSRLRVYGSPVCAGVPPETLRNNGAGTQRAQLGCYMGEGPAGSCLMPENCYSCMQHKPVHVVETDAPLRAGLWAQLHDIRACGRLPSMYGARCLECCHPTGLPRPPVQPTAPSVQPAVSLPHGPAMPPLPPAVPSLPAPPGFAAPHGPAVPPCPAASAGVSPATPRHAACYAARRTRRTGCRAARHATGHATGPTPQLTSAAAA
jgi:hypothetical protein